MKHLSILVLVALSVLNACSTLKRPFFYEASKEKATFHILGSLRSGVPASDLPKFVHRELDKSGSLISEMGEESLEQNNAKNKAADRRLSSKLSPASWKIFVRLLPSNISPDDAQFFSPQFAYELFLQLTQSPVEKYNYEARALSTSMDLELTKVASKAKKLVLHLDHETPLLQPCFTALLEESLNTYNPNDNFKGIKALDEHERLVAAYRNGDEMVAWALFSANKVHRCSIQDRNSQWLQRMQEMAANPETPWPAFATMNVAHLLGPNNLLERLKAEGFQVRRVESESP